MGLWFSMKTQTGASGQMAKYAIFILGENLSYLFYFTTISLNVY